MRVVPKNSRATIRVRVSYRGGSPFLDVRTWTEPGDGQAKPTRKGLTIPLASIPAFLAAVETVGREGRSQAA